MEDFIPRQSLDVSTQERMQKKKRNEPLYEFDSPSEGGEAFMRKTRFVKSSKHTKKGKSVDIRASEGDFIPFSEELGRKKRRKDKKFGKTLKKTASVPESLVDMERLVKEEVSLAEQPEEILCLVARTALILPFSFRIDDFASTLQLLEMVQRKSVVVERQRVQMWLPALELPREVGDLSPLFRQVFGWREAQGHIATMKTWSCNRFTLNPKILKSLFAAPKLCTVQSGEEEPYEVDFTSIELFLYPLRVALLVIHVDWLPARLDQTLSLDDFRTLLFVSKYRHKIQEVCNGWGFTQEMRKLSELDPDHIKCLGSDMANALYQGSTVSLCTLGNWLLHLPDEDPSSPPFRLDYARHANHQTTVVIPRQPSSQLLQRFLFHLRHAFGQKNRPPLQIQETLGKVLVWRLNRYIGMSKEGNVSISWPLNFDPNGNPHDDFELSQWHRKFQGVFLLLALHAHGEKFVLFELSDLAASQAEKMKMVTTSVDLADMKTSRDSLRELASSMVRYTLGMSSNDCGGTSEYSDFFSSLRRMFGIPQLREELSNELKDVLAVVESNYLEEERRQRDKEEARKHQRYLIEKKLRRERDRQDNTMGILISVIGSFTLPFVMVGGIFGMNNTNLPADVDFYTLMGLTLAFSFIILIALLGGRYFVRHRLKKIHKNKLVAIDNIDDDEE